MCLSSLSVLVECCLPLLLVVLEAETTTVAPQSCVLPVEPDVQNVEEQGTRFGLAEDSRFEFDTFANFQSNIRKEIRLKFVLFFISILILFCFRRLLIIGYWLTKERIFSSNNVKMAVKTYASEGMIWFIGSTKDNPDYTTLYLKDGLVVFQNNLGMPAASLVLMMIVSSNHCLL